MLNIKTILLSATTIAITTAAASTAMAAKSDFTSKMDLNGDASITLQEMRSAATTRFNAADNNVDGYLSAEEKTAGLKAMAAERLSEKFDAQDTNSDGVLTKDEVESNLEQRADKGDRPERSERSDRSERGERSKNGDRSERGGLRAEIKERVDTNNDGEIDDAEKQAAKAAFKQHRADRSDRDCASNETRTRGNRATLDADNDGLISLAELDASITAKFEKADDNSDGVISGDELNRKGGRNGERGGKRSR